MSTSTQLRKEKIISELVEARRRILDTVSSLSPSQTDRVFLGIWSAKDLLAHLVGWDFTNTEAATEILAGKLPSFYSYHDRDWRTYNAGLVAEYKRQDLSELLSLVQDSHQKLVDFLRTVPAAEFGKDKRLRFRGYKVTIARLLQAEIDDEGTHYLQVKEFAGRNHSLPHEEV